MKNAIAEKYSFHINHACHLKNLSHKYGHYQTLHGKQKKKKNLWANIQNSTISLPFTNNRIGKRENKKLKNYNLIIKFKR